MRQVGLSAVVAARWRGGADAPPVPLFGLAAGLGRGLTVRALMPDDAAIRRRGGPGSGCGGPHVGVRPVIGRPKPCCRQDLCHACY